MGVMEDTIGEFKKAKPPEKAIIVGSVVAVVGVAWYLHRQSQSAAGSTAASGSPSSSSPGTPQSGWSSVPSPSSGNTPILPAGYNPIYDPNGNLVGYGPTPPPTTPPPTTPPPPPPTQGGGNPPTGSPIPQPSGNGALIPWGQYNGPNTGTMKWGTTYSYGGSTYQLGVGNGGRLWGVPLANGVQPYTLQQWNNIPIAQGGKTLLYAPPSPAAPKQGGGAYGTRVLGQHGKRVAPTREGQPYVARSYARRRV